MMVHELARLAYGTLRDRAPRLRGRKRFGHALAWALARREPVAASCFGLRFQLDLRDRVEEGIFFEDYDREIVRDWESWIRPGDVVFDVGANVGLYSLVAARAGAEVHAFEPNPRTREKLVRNIALNGFGERVSVHAEALSDRIADGQLFDDVNRGRSVGNAGVASLSSKNAGGGAVAVRMITLDSFASAAGLTRVDFIKMDIQGAELHALKGGASTLARFHPTLIIEMEPVCARNMGWSEADLREYLDQLGYQVHALDSMNLIARHT